MCVSFMWGETTWWVALFLTCLAATIVTVIAAVIFEPGSGSPDRLTKVLRQVCVTAVDLSILGIAISLIGIAGTFAFGLLT